MPLLGINIDHVATIREARKTIEPDPVLAAKLCEKAGCDSIVAHLREDRRHIHDRDVHLLRSNVSTRFNLEMSIAEEIVAIACRLKPDQATLVPERRQEVTTEGGLDVARSERAVTKAVVRLLQAGIEVSLFIDPSLRQIEASRRTGARIIEIHTGEYANAASQTASLKTLKTVHRATQYALDKGITVNAGHGLTYKNVRPIARIPGMHELNIGHSIISRAVFVGIEKAVREMIALTRNGA